MMSYAIHSDFSQLSIKHFNDEFARIRERGMSSQVLMHRDSSVRPVGCSGNSKTIKYKLIAETEYHSKRDFRHVCDPVADEKVGFERKC